MNQIIPVDGFEFHVDQNQELRITSELLASKLGYAKRSKLEELASRHTEFLNEFGEVPTTGISVSASAVTRIVQMPLYNVEQAKYLISKSELPIANKLTVQLIKAHKELERRLAQQITLSVDPLIAQAETALAISREFVRLRDEQVALRLAHANVEERVTQLEEHRQPDPEFYTILAWSKILGMKLSLPKAASLGKRATRDSEQSGYPIQKVLDPRFGLVGAYHTDILESIMGARST
jgi:hypothetical protein